MPFGVPDQNAALGWDVIFELFVRSVLSPDGGRKLPYKTLLSIICLYSHSLSHFNEYGSLCHSDVPKKQFFDIVPRFG